LFDDVLLESTGGEKRRRKLTLFATLAGEALVIAALVSIPLLYLDAVPGYSAKAGTFHVPLTPAPIGITTERPDSGARPRSGSVPSPQQPAHLLPHPTLPYGAPRENLIPDDYPDGDPTATRSWGVPNGVRGGTGTDLVSPPTIPAPPAHRRTISHIDEGMIVHRVEPIYPPLAKQARIQGEVVLRAIISKDGRIDGLQVINGHPLLAGAAVNAVSQWRFRPYLLNGSPIEVDAQIKVHFVLGGS